MVFARTRPADDKGAGIAVFLVPADTAGVEVGVKDKKMGQEGAWTADVSFTDVRVPDAALVGGSEDIGYRAAMTSLARGRVHIAALAVGTAQRALDESVAYAATATQGGTPIGEFQLVQAMIADQQTGVLGGTGPGARHRTQVGQRGGPPHRAVGREAVLHRDGRARWPISPYRSTAAPGTCGRCPSNASTATSACCGSTRAPARSSASSSAAGW